MHGILVVDKPRGPTSHDIVERIRRLVRPSRVGHTGTLDPMATGVLVLCIGTATRLARFLTGGLKEYTGEIVFGAATDTYDASGRITEERPADGLTLDAVRKASAGFRGDLKQVPPPWSAKKIKGRRAYDLARQGEARALPPCDVRIEIFEILGLLDGRSPFRTVCSGGTYVRSLAHDLGQALHCGAHLASLRRTASGPFTAAGALPLAAVEEAAEAGGLADVVLPLEAIDLGLPGVRLTEHADRLAAAGRFIPEGELAGGLPAPQGSWVRLLTSTGLLSGIGEVAAGGAPGVQPRIILTRHPS